MSRKLDIGWKRKKKNPTFIIRSYMKELPTYSNDYWVWVTFLGLTQPCTLPLHQENSLSCPTSLSILPHLRIFLETFLKLGRQRSISSSSAFLMLFPWLCHLKRKEFSLYFYNLSCANRAGYPGASCLKPKSSQVQMEKRQSGGAGENAGLGNKPLKKKL